MSNHIDFDRRRFLGAAAMTMIASQLGIIRCDAIELANEGDVPSLSGATEWLNSEQVTRESLFRKVALIEFWTYSCINWRRTLPYVRAWAGKYKDNGLIVIGVHAPEFAFEKNVDNVRWATKDMKITYPVAIDNDRAIWNAFNNQYWPALFLSIPRDIFAIMYSAKANMTSRSKSSNNYWPRPERVPFLVAWFRST